jgi:YD repeat-containing protein
MFTFDGANQLVSSTVDGVTTRYTYDAAGRLVKEGNKTYRYGYLDKVMSVSDGKQKLTYDYHADGQIASADYGNGKTENSFGMDLRSFIAVANNLLMSRMSEMRRRSYASKGSRERSEAPVGPARGRAEIRLCRLKECRISTICSVQLSERKKRVVSTPQLLSQPLVSSPE